MAAPNSAASKKAAKAGAKKISITKPGIKKTKSKKNPAAVKKASPLRKIGDKAIKKTTGKKAKQTTIKGGLGGAKNNLEGGAKASAGGVAAFDLEAFVKVKFSELEKTAHQKKVSQMLLSLQLIPCFRTCLDRPTAPWPI